MNSVRRLLWGICFLLAIVGIGVIGYVIIEGWSFLDAIYMTIQTITTVGYNEVHTLTEAGRIFSLVLMFGGVGGALYAVTVIIAYILEGHFSTTFGRRRTGHSTQRKVPSPRYGRTCPVILGYLPPRLTLTTKNRK